MKEIAVLLLITLVSSTIKETRGAKIWGPMTNISDLMMKIWLKGSQQLRPNLLPDVTFNDKTRQRKPGADAAVGRRFLKDIIADKRKQIQYGIKKQFLGNDNEDTQFFDNDNVNTALVHSPEIFDVSRSTGIKDLGKRIQIAAGLKSRRTHRSPEVVQRLLIQYQHKRKMNEIKIFLDSSYVATEYIYKEVKRIKKDKVIMDPLRKMVKYISQPWMDDLVNSIFKCFQEKRKIYGPPKDVWKLPTNNLVINVLKDPYNDGFIN